LDEAVNFAMRPISTGVAAVGAAHFVGGTAVTAGTVAAAGTAAAAVALPIVGSILVGAGVGALLGGVELVMYTTVKGYGKLIISTDAVLDLAIQEALKWQYGRPNKKDNSTEPVSKEKKLELLEKKLELLGKYENLTQS